MRPSCEGDIMGLSGGASVHDGAVYIESTGAFDLNSSTAVRPEINVDVQTVGF